MKCTLRAGGSRVEADILKDFHDFGANIQSREIFLHNHYTSEDSQNPGVEYRMSNTFLKNLRAIDLKSDENIIIHMNSIGGEWADGMAMFDALQMCKSYTTVIAYGQAESMSSIVLQAAKRRLITPNSHFMAHFGSTGTQGDYQSVQNFIKHDKYTCDVMLNIYTSRCIIGPFFKERFGKKPTLPQVKNFLLRKFKSGDWYLNAEQAVHYGFVDAVIKNWQ